MQETSNLIVSESTPFAPPAPPQPGDAAIRQAIEIFHAGTHLVELRPRMPDGRWWSGFYDDREKLAPSIASLNAIGAVAVYCTVNPVSRTLADRVTNRLAPAKKHGCTGNSDIGRIRWLFLDLDNKGSREATLTLAENIKTYLAGKGWDEPHLISSGTGYYLFYPVRSSPIASPTHQEGCQDSRQPIRHGRGNRG